MKHLQRGLAKLVCVLLLFQTGCQKEGISSYEVARIESKSKENPTGPVRLLAAIFQQGDATWFFKLMGSVPDVESVEKDYDKFLQSVQFKKAGETPPLTFEAPASWQKGATSDLRFATLLPLPQTNPKFELTVIKLGKDSGSVLANINRWREQVGLEAVSDGDLGKFIKKTTIHGSEAILADFTGPGGKKGMGMPPFAKMGKPPIPRPDQPTPGNNGLPSVSKFQKPEGWDQIANLPMSVLTLRLSKDGSKLDVTVTPLAGNAGGLESNINRWRTQLNLAPWSPEEIAKNTKKVDHPSGNALLIEITSPQESILGGIIGTQNTTWFIKLRGPAALAATQKTNFEKFITSLGFSEGAKP